MMEKDFAIVLPVGGISSRFNEEIKQLVEVGPNNETLIEYSLDQALKAGFTKIIFIVGEHTENILKDKFKDNYKGVPVLYTKQEFDKKSRDRPWGTADALCSIKDIIDCPFVFCNSDDIYGEETFRILVNHLKNNNEEATIGYKLIDTLPDLGSKNMAIFQTENNYVSSIDEVYNIEKNNLEKTNTLPDDLASNNIYALHKETVKLLNEKVMDFKEKNNGDRKIESLIQHEITNLIKDGKIKMKIYNATERPFGITRPEDVEVVKKIISEKSMKDQDTAIVYLVAGLSSRFGGRIKQFATVGPDRESLIEYSIKQAINAGFNKIIFVVGNKTEEPFKEKFGNNYKGVPIEYALQYFDENKRDRPWGTCDALCAINKIITCPFVIAAGDDLYGENTLKTLHNHLIKYYNDSNKEATVASRLSDMIPEEGSVNRGIFSLEDGKVKSITEVLGITKSNIEEKKLKPNDYCSISIFALHPETVHLLNNKLIDFKESHEEDRKIECFLPSMLTELIKEKKIGMDIYESSEKWLGITNPEDEGKVREILSNFSDDKN